MRKILVIVTLLAAPLCAQEIQWPASFEALAGKAKESINVTLDSSLLGFASGFLSNNDKDEAKAKDLIGKLKGIYVRGFEFSEDGAYSKSDLDDIRKQLVSQQWTPIVDVTDNDESAQVFVKKDGDAIGGLTIVAAEKRELIIVHILGPVSVNDIASLGGSFGIPRMSFDALGGNLGGNKVKIKPATPPRPPQPRQ